MFLKSDHKSYCPTHRDSLAALALLLLAIFTPFAEGAFSCKVKEKQNGNAIVLFTDNPGKRKAKLVHVSAKAVIDVRKLDRYTVKNGAGSEYKVRLKNPKKVVECKLPPPKPYSCTWSQVGKDDLKLLSSGTRGNTENILINKVWLQELTSSTKSKAVIKGVTVPDPPALLTVRLRGPTFQNPFAEVTCEELYSCSVSVAGKNKVLLEFRGKRGGSENVRRNGEFSETLSGQTSVVLEGSPQDTWTVRLRGKGYSDNCNDCFTKITCWTNDETGNIPTGCEIAGAKVSEKLVPCNPSKALFGSTGDPIDRNGNKIGDGTERDLKVTDFLDTEALVKAGSFDVFHDFYSTWDSFRTFASNPVMQNLADSGKIFFLNWKSSVAQWPEIAKGDHDADIVATVEKIRSFGHPIFLTFFHEPEDNIKDLVKKQFPGSWPGNEPPTNKDAIELSLQKAEEYASAFRHIVTTFRNEYKKKPLKNSEGYPVWVWDVQGFRAEWQNLYEGDGTRSLYPGNDYIDWVGWNPYNWFKCDLAGQPLHRANGKSKSFRDIVRSMYDWVESHSNIISADMPLMLGEFSTSDSVADSSVQSEWWKDAAKTVAASEFPRLRAFIYFGVENRKRSGEDKGKILQFCAWQPKRNIDGFKEFVTSSRFGL